MSDEDQQGSKDKRSLGFKITITALIVVVVLAVAYGVLYAASYAGAYHARAAYDTDRENCTANYEKQNQIALKAYWDGGTYTPPASCDKIAKEIKAGVLGLPKYVTSTVE